MKLLFLSTRLKLASLNRKLYVDIKNALSCEIPITSKSVHPSIQNLQTEIVLFLQNYSLQLKTLEVFKIVIFKFTSLKLGLLNRKLYIDFKTGLNLENPITNEAVDPYSLFF